MFVFDESWSAGNTFWPVRLSTSTVWCLQLGAVQGANESSGLKRIC